MDSHEYRMNIKLLDGMRSRGLAEARKWLGATSPNPAVGAVALDAQGEILAVAAHKRAGEPHAEAALHRNYARAQNYRVSISIRCASRSSLAIIMG